MIEDLTFKEGKWEGKGEEKEKGENRETGLRDSQIHNSEMKREKAECVCVCVRGCERDLQS